MLEGRPQHSIQTSIGDTAMTIDAEILVYIALADILFYIMVLGMVMGDKEK